MERTECPYCEEVFFGSYDEREASIDSHLRRDHAPEDAPSADNGYAPPRSKHIQSASGRTL